MNVSPLTFITDTIIQCVLDSVCTGCYKHTNYYNLSGYEKADMIYYKPSKFGFISTTPIYYADSNISDINLNRFYYKDTNLIHTHDTTFLSIILVHLESGSSSASARATEIAGAMAWLNANVTTLGNYIFMGDFNTQSFTEACYQSLITSPNLPTLFFDPVYQSGDWGPNPSLFANFLTQSTRTTDPGDCGSTGGMNDWFDHILLSEPVLYGLQSVQYIPGSYTTIGQDGLHTLAAINGSPTNTSVPSDVLNALYYMSSHLPVSIKIAITLSSTDFINNNNKIQDDVSVFPNPASDFIIIKMKSINNKINKIKLINTLGITVKEIALSTINLNNEIKINVNDIAKGVYFAEVIDNAGNVLSIKKIIKY